MSRSGLRRGGLLTALVGVPSFPLSFVLSTQYLLLRLGYVHRLTGCIGSQGHLTPGQGAAHVQALKVLAATGVKEVATTELDIQQAPANDYATVVQGCLEIESCVGVTVWGVRDTVSRLVTAPCYWYLCMSVGRLADACYRTRGARTRTRCCSMEGITPSRRTMPLCRLFRGRFRIQYLVKRPIVRKSSFQGVTRGGLGRGGLVYTGSGACKCMRWRGTYVSQAYTCIYCRPIMHAALRPVISTLSALGMVPFATPQI